jgi:hypothetical protein
MAPEDQDVTTDPAPVEPAPKEPAPSMDAMSPKRRTGLIVVVGALLLLLIAGVAGAAQLMPLFRSTTGPEERDTTGDNARITFAIEFMEKVIIPNDVAAVKPFLTDDAQNAITAAQWSEVASMGAESVVASVTFTPAAWTGETTATVGYNVEETTGTMLLAQSPDEPNTVVLTDIGAEGPQIYDIVLAPAGSGWRVLSYTPRSEKFFLDAAWVESLAAPAPDEVPAP